MNEIAGDIHLIVVMEKGSTEAQIAAIIEQLEKNNLKGELSRGVERAVIGVIGENITDDLRAGVAAMSGVGDVLRVSKPYKRASREFKAEDTVVHVKGVKIGGGADPVVMAGPCTIESEEQVVETAHRVKAAGAKILRGGAFKPRTSPYSFRGFEEEGLKLIKTASQETGLPIVTEVMSVRDVELVSRYADILQIGTRSAQNFMLLDEVGMLDKPVLLKRGYAATYEDWLLSAEYILAGGNTNVILCERGVRTFETYTRNTLDVAAMPVIHRLSHLPVIADPSHGTGHWHLVVPLSVASIAAGADGLLVEVHPNPDQALCDGPQSVTFENFELLMDGVNAVTEVGLRNRVPMRAQPVLAGV